MDSNLKSTSKPNDIPLVSICCVTYNHIDYIEEALNSFLRQVTNFQFEIIIHDDVSTDGTTNIIRRFEANYPSIIRPIYQTENQFSKGKKVTAIAMAAARGKYIALCEGDDYWTDPEKLQRQVNFLEENPTYSLSAENSLVINSLSKTEYLFSDLETTDLSVKDLITGRKFHTASVVFKKEDLVLPKNFNEFPIGDTLLFVSLASKGKVRYNSFISSVYNRNEGGMTENNKSRWPYIVEKFNNLLDEFTEHKYSSVLKRNISKQFYSTAKYNMKRKNVIEAFKAVNKSLEYRLKSFM